MANGPIGTAYVEISADTRKTATEIERGLSSAGDKIGDTLGQAIEKGMAAGAKEGAEKAAKNISGALDDAMDDVADTLADGMERAAREAADNLSPLEEALQVIAQTKFGLDLDTSAAQAAARELRDQLATLEIDLPVDADVTQLEAALDEARRKIEGLPPAEIDVQVDEDKIRRAAGALDDVDQAARRAESGGKVTSSAFRDMTEAFGGADSALFGMGESFEGMMDVLEGFGGKLGLSAGAVAGLTTALGGALAILGTVGIAFTLFQTVMKNFNKDAEEAKKRTQEWTEALIEANGAIEDVATQRLDEIFKLDPKLVDTALDMGLSAADLADVITGKTVPAFEKVRKETEVATKFIKQYGEANLLTVEAIADELDITNEQARALIEVNSARRSVIGDMEKEADAAGMSTQQYENYVRIHADVEGIVTDTSLALEGYSGVLTEADLNATRYMDTTQATVDAIEAQEVAFTDARVAAFQLAKEYERITASSVVDTWDEINDRADTFVSILGDVRDAAARPMDVFIGMIEANEAWSKALEENGKTLDITTEKGRANYDVLQQQADAMATAVEETYRQTASYEDAAAKADEFRLQLYKQLKQMGITGDEAEEYVRTLGLMPDQVETTIELAKGEEARKKVQELSDIIAELPPEVETTVTQSILAGDYEAALATVQKYFDDHPAGMGTDVAIPSPSQIAAIVTAVTTHMTDNPAGMATDVQDPSQDDVDETAIAATGMFSPIPLTTTTKPPTKSNVDATAIAATGLFPPIVIPTVLGPPTGTAGGRKWVPFALGGIVKGTPGGTLALLGEGGRDEAVVPLTRPKRAMSILEESGLLEQLLAKDQLRAEARQAPARDITVNISGQREPERTASDFVRELRALQWRLGQRLI